MGCWLEREFEVKALRFFKEQVTGLDEKTKRIIHDKIELVKANPYRYKKIRSRQYSRVFRIRFSIGGKGVRMVYALIGSRIVLVCLLDRKRDYENLEKYLKTIKE